LTTSHGTIPLNRVPVAAGNKVQVPQLAAPPLRLPRSFSLLAGGMGQGNETNLDDSYLDAWDLEWGTIR